MEENLKYNGYKDIESVIGRSKHIRCFKGEGISKLPLDIMTTWLHKFDTRMRNGIAKYCCF